MKPQLLALLSGVSILAASALADARPFRPDAPRVFLKRSIDAQNAKVRA